MGRRLYVFAEALLYPLISGVEDQLQERVPETVEFLLESGLTIMMLTGDKKGANLFCLCYYLAIGACMCQTILF